MDTAAQLPASTTYLHLLCCVRSHPSFIIMIINVTHRCVPALAFLVWQFGDANTFFLLFNVLGNGMHPLAAR